MSRLRTARVTALYSLLLAACFVTSEEAPPPQSGPPRREAQVVVAPPPPAVAASPGQPPPAPPPPPAVAAVAPLPPAAILPPADGRYPIQLERPAVAGAAYRVQAHGTKTIRKNTLIPGQPARSQTERLVVDLSALVRVGAVNERGDATRLDVQVEQCRTESNGAAETLLPPGSLLTIESAPRPSVGRFLVGGREVDPHLSDYLEILFSRSNGATSDDDTFGTPVPRRAGERWEPNATIVAAELSTQIPGLTPGDVRGRVTFHGPTELQGIPALDVGVQLQLRARAMPNLPPGTVLERGDMRLEMRSLFPRDPALPALRDRASMNVRALLHVPTPAGTVTLQMQIDQDKELERTPVR